MALPSISKPDGSDFYTRFFQLASVNILSNLMVPLAGLVDVAFLGHLEVIASQLKALVTLLDYKSRKLLPSTGIKGQNSQLTINGSGGVNSTVA